MVAKGFSIASWLEKLNEPPYTSTIGLYLILPLLVLVGSLIFEIYKGFVYPAVIITIRGRLGLSPKYTYLCPIITEIMRTLKDDKTIKNISPSRLEKFYFDLRNNTLKQTYSEERFPPISRRIHLSYCCGLILFFFGGVGFGLSWPNFALAAGIMIVLGVVLVSIAMYTDSTYEKSEVVIFKTHKSIIKQSAKKWLAP